MRTGRRCQNLHRPGDCARQITIEELIALINLLEGELLALFLFFLIIVDHFLILCHLRIRCLRKRSIREDVLVRFILQDAHQRALLNLGDRLGAQRVLLLGFERQRLFHLLRSTYHEC